MSPKMWEQILKDIVPKAGFIWDFSGPVVLRSLDDDNKASASLSAAAARFNRANIEPLLTQLFTVAAARARTGDIPRASGDKPDAQDKWIARLRRKFPLELV